MFAGEHVDLLACQLVGEFLRETSSHVLMMTSCPDNVPPSLHVGEPTCLQDAGACSTGRTERSSLVFELTCELLKKARLSAPRAIRDRGGYGRQDNAAD